MDYRLYHAVNSVVIHHPWLGRAFADVESVGVIAFALATCGLWLVAPRLRFASATALGSAGLALLVNRAIAALWDRKRPFATHSGAHVWGGRSHDPSFPSDHASAAFAIAFAFFLFDRLVGALFLAAATVIAVGRVVVGAHYPGDVVAGCLVGLGCALVVVRLTRPLIAHFGRR